MSRQTNGQLDGYMAGQKDKRTDGWTDGRILLKF